MFCRTSSVIKSHTFIEGKSPIDVTIIHDRYEMFLLLTEHYDISEIRTEARGCSYAMTRGRWNLQDRRNGHWTPFHTACRHDKIKFAKKILDLAPELLNATGFCYPGLKSEKNGLEWSLYFGNVRLYEEIIQFRDIG